MAKGNFIFLFTIDLIINNFEKIRKNEQILYPYSSIVIDFIFLFGADMFAELPTGRLNLAGCRTIEFRQYKNDVLFKII